MRLRPWLTSPTTRPPDSLSRALPSSPPATPPPPPRSRPRPLPPAVAQAWERAQHRAKHPLPPIPPDATASLRLILSQLPPISLPPRLNLRPHEDLEQDLAQWRRACAAAYDVLSRNTDDDAQRRALVQPAVAKTVGHTMRLLLRLGAVDAARQLDEAFFSNREGKKGRWAKLQSEGGKGKGGKGGDGGEAVRRFKRFWGERKGLGLARGDIRLAWMLSFAVRLEQAVRREEGDERALVEFGELLREMYEQRGDEAVREDECLTAFLTRKMGVVQEQLAGAAGRRRMGGEGESEGIEQVREQVRRLLRSIKDAEADEVEVVSFALLETGLDRLERTRGSVLDDPFFPQVEADIQSLVGSLESGTGFRALHNLFLTFTSSVERHAHILHLAIRFLLLRARHHDPSAPSSSRATHPLQSASQLYSLLLDLSPRVDSSDYEALSRLRQRQSSALYRLLAAHNAALEDLSSAASIASRALDLVDLTLASLAALPPTTPPYISSSHLTPPPPDPRLLGISTRFFRRLLFALARTLLPPSSHSTPSSSVFREAHPASSSPVPAVPFSLLARAMSTMIAAKEYDAALLPKDAAIEAKGKGREVLLVHEKPLVEQPNLAMAFVRAALASRTDEGVKQEEDDAGGFSSALSSSATLTDHSTPLARLSTLLRFTEFLESTSTSSRPSSPHSPGFEAGERRARRLLSDAVSLLIRELYPGEAARGWRDETAGKVREWAAAGRDWESVRRRVGEGEGSKGEWWEARKGEGKAKRGEGEKGVKERRGQARKVVRKSSSTPPRSSSRPPRSTVSPPHANKSSHSSASRPLPKPSFFSRNTSS